MPRKSASRINYQKALARLTGTRAACWKPANGPETRCGVDYYFEHRSRKSEAYINWDQGHVTISVDGETLFSGMEEKLPQ